MSIRRLLIVWLLALFVFVWHSPAKAFQQIERGKDKEQTKVLAKLKRGTFIRVRTASEGDVRGHFRSFDGPYVVLEEQRFTHSREVFVHVNDIVQIKTGRGFLGSLQHGFTESARILAKPVIDFINAYRMMDAMGDLMY